MEQAVLKSVGTKLKDARKARNLTIEDVAAEIMVPQHYLQSIEEDRFERLPGQTYAVGFVRNYSRYLDLVPEQIIEDLRGQFTFPKTLDSVEIASGFVTQRRPSLLPSMGSVLAGLCVVGAVYGLWTVAADGESTAALPTTVPVVDFVAPKVAVADVKPAAAKSLPAKSLPVSQPARVERASATPEATRNQQAIAVIESVEFMAPLPRPSALPRPVDVETLKMLGASSDDAVAVHIAEESWIEITTQDQIYFTGVKQPGETLMIPAHTAENATLTTGNAGGIWVSVGNWASTTIGAPGRVRRNLELAPSSLVAILSPAKPS
ncbi:MAG: RodZ domain-containing protein [Pseudomonadota bacterium]